MPNGNLITGSLDTYIRIWDLETGSCLKNIRSFNQIHCLKYLNHGYLFVGKASNTTASKKKDYKICNIKILNISNNVYKLVKKIRADAHNCELSPDGNYLLTCCSRENLIRVQNIKFE